MIIEVMEWADFDIPYTKWIGESLEYSNHDETKEVLVKEFLAFENITDFEFTPNDAVQISPKLLHGLTDKFIEFLKRRGFKKVSTVKIKFSDAGI